MSSQKDKYVFLMSLHSHLANSLFTVLNRLLKCANFYVSEDGLIMSSFAADQVSHYYLNLEADELPAYICKEPQVLGVPFALFKKQSSSDSKSLINLYQTQREYENCHLCMQLPGKTFQARLLDLDTEEPKELNDIEFDLVVQLKSSDLASWIRDSSGCTYAQFFAEYTPTSCTVYMYSTTKSSNDGYSAALFNHKSVRIDDEACDPDGKTVYIGKKSSSVYQIQNLKNIAYAQDLSQYVQLCLSNTDGFLLAVNFDLGVGTFRMVQAAMADVEDIPTLTLDQVKERVIISEPELVHITHIRNPDHPNVVNVYSEESKITRRPRVPEPESEPEPEPENPEDVVSESEEELDTPSPKVKPLNAKRKPAPVFTKSAQEPQKKKLKKIKLKSDSSKPKKKLKKIKLKKKVK